MHKREIQEAFSQLHASEELVKEVIALKSEKKNDGRAWRIVARVAVCAAVVAMMMTWMLWPGKPDAPGDDGVVKAPGMLKVYAFDLTSGEDLDDCKSYVLEEGDETTYIGIWSPSYSYNNTIGLPIRLELVEPCFAENEVTFDVCLEHGGFYVEEKGRYSRKGKQLTTDNDETIFWVSYDEEKNGEKFAGETYVDIIIRADEKIVGYTIIKIVRTHPAYATFASVLVKNVIFPVVNGEFQEITEEYVREQMLKGR